MDAIGLNPIKLDAIGLDPIRMNAIRLGVPGASSGSGRPRIAQARQDGHLHLGQDKRRP